jgi:hypothetical protein
MANGIEEYLLKDEKIEVQPINDLTVNSENGFTGYITNKRVIFHKKNYMSSNFQDIPYINLQGAASIQLNKTSNWLYLGVILGLLGLILINVSLIFILIICAGILSIMVWYFIPKETLNLKGTETKFVIEANKNVLYRMLKDIRSNQKI